MIRSLDRSHKACIVFVGKASRFEMCPGLLSVSHGPNEYVDLRDVYRCAAIYALTELRSLGAV